MRVEPYLYFNGRCDEALELYRKVLGAEVTFLMRFKDAPPSSTAMPVPGEKVMHANVRIGESIIMVSDGSCSGAAQFSGVTLTISAKDAAEADRIFAAFSDGGRVQRPITETFFSPRFGMVADRFGVSWMVMVSQ